ncbi:UPF0182 protein [Pseudoclavibacter endophyticus]|uniref:UPF0182 protein F8O04_06050 n=1 Tax=Pseudoclavibacter endophyticus TaxID=1778590 RepID=A0A6H9WWI1_9MICO|nr:UPF0182 family protein [Pseudoclavibacter endophyticus]GGA59714.1 UPF0182 protein [Pseudoclavibacter endophyticus]
MVVIALIAVFFWFSGFYADILWYDQLGALSVLLTQWGAGAVMFLIGLVAMAVPVIINLQIAYRARPVYAKLNDQLDRYQQVIEPLRRVAMFGVPILIGLVAGLVASGAWPTVIQWMHATPFGVADPRFGFDISFYVFHLPFWRGVIAFASAVTMVSLLLTAATTYLYGGIRVTGRDVVISKSARMHVAILAGLYLLLQAVSIWFDRYALLTSYNERWTGAMYTDTMARIPGLAVLAGACAIVAVLFFIAAVIGRWRLPLAGLALVLVVGLVVGVGYPWAVQQFQVGPSEQALEQPYIEDNIEATRSAYGIDDVEVVPYDAQTSVSPGQLREDAETTSNIRIVDPALVQPTFAQLHQERTYYQFNSPLDVDRYDIDGQVHDTVSGIRDINVAGLDGGAQSWVNTTLVYTHGYGLVAAYGNQRMPDGTPLLMEGNMPTMGELPDYRPQVYFGENSPEYSIVGQPEGSSPIEFDHVSGEDGQSQTYTTFDEEGGPSIGNFFNRLIYSIKFQSEQILLSEYVTEESQILYDRDPALRVAKVAPYLNIDTDPYASVVDGRLMWIIDGYTTTDAYPYSTQQSMQQLIADTPAAPLPGQASAINYIRNSVKATVDAYSGEVTLYAWDEEDPILQTWSKVFPTTIQPMTEMSGDLLSHVRYPTDMFKVQRATLATYHVTDPVAFYNRQNAWELPQDPTAGATDGRIQSPYYLTTQMPDQDSAYALYSTYIPRVNQGGQTRNVLTGYLSANANAGSTDGTVAEDYGRLTLLQVTNDNIPGPGQVQNSFNSDPVVANQLNLLERGGQTEVLRGNLLTLPVGGGFLFVQPVYVQSTGQTSYPLLRRVLVAFGERVAFEDTLDQALDTLFGGDSGADAGDEEVAPDDGEGGGTEPDPALSAADRLNEALDEAAQALEDRTNAYASNDLVAAAEADSRLQAALAEADAANAELQAELGNPVEDPGAGDTADATDDEAGDTGADPEATP